MKRITKNKEHEENKKKELEFEEITSRFIREERSKMEENIYKSLDKMFDDEMKEIKTYKEFNVRFEYKNKFKIDNAQIQDDINIINKM